jgi:hypothetical protein
VSVKGRLGRGTGRASARSGRLVVYVTSHGFGHLNRTAAVLNCVPTGVPITIRAHSNLFEHWRERLTRPADLEHYVSDVGAVNPPGDSATTDAAATLELAIPCHREAMARVDDEAARLVALEAVAVLCDAPAVPLVAARRACVPGFLTANFTWADIYAPYARGKGGAAGRLVADLRQAYRKATTVFRTEPGLRMSWLGPKIEVGMVVNRRRDRRSELRRFLGVKPAQKLVYLYVGRYGQNDLDWARLGRLANRGIHFVGYPPRAEDSPDNFHVVPSAGWPGGELIGASDAIVAKAGYGTVCETMAARVPMIYPPRTAFAEYRVLDRALRTWGGGVPVPARDFRELKLERALERALALKPGPPPFTTDGAKRIADHLTAVCTHSR